MATDRILTTVLKAYLSLHDADQTSRILGSTTSLLTALTNPLNITVITSQLLIAPAIWSQPDGLRTCLRIISIFNTAAIAVRQNELDTAQNIVHRPAGGVNCDDWTRAVIKGANDRSPRWRHLLVLAGILIGMESQDRQGLSQGLRTTLERALVMAANLALSEPQRDGPIGAQAVVLALNHSFELISDANRRDLNYDALAPLMVHAIVGPEGYQDGYFLAAVDIDIRTSGNKFDWPSKSSSFLQLQVFATKPILTSMGPLSRLLAHTVENLADSRQILDLLDELVRFTGSLQNQWRQTKLSELDPSEVNDFLTPETIRVTYPMLWQVLKSAMFATVVVLRPVIGRTLIDPVLARDVAAPAIASRVLHILRNVYFISSRLGANAFSAYTFAFLTSIDLLSRYPAQSKLFLVQMQPTQAGQIPKHPLDRNLDLFFLNTCEHFTLILTQDDNESLILKAATPYLNPNAHKNLLEIFEAAHSAMLAVLAAPQNAGLTTRIIPFYTEALFSSFPTNLSPRQFRFAFKTLLHITTPPAPLSASQPLLPDTLLELLYHRAQNAPTAPLPPPLVLKSDVDTAATGSQPPVSEQAVLTLTLLDALPYLAIQSLGEWLPLAANLINIIDNDSMREMCKARLWDVLEGGEMDIDRAAVCVAWWTSRGGREMVMFGREKKMESNGPFMSGGLGCSDGSRL